MGEVKAHTKVLRGGKKGWSHEHNKTDKMIVSMFGWHFLLYLLLLLVTKMCSAENSHEYLLKKLYSDVAAVAGKLKHVHSLARSADGPEDTAGIFGVQGTGCPFLDQLDKKLEELRKERENALNESLSEIREMVSPEKLQCDDVTEVRDKVLAKLNASLTCEAPPACNESLPYRQPDGSCNNVKHPEWGKAGTCFHRVLPPAYADGVSQIRVTCNNTELPNARLISMTLHNEMNKTDASLTHLATIFGQFITHDITFVPTGALPSIEFKFGTGAFNACEAADPNCLSVKVPENDTFYSRFNVTRLPRKRSYTCVDCNLGYREQVNSRTTYLDLSQVYGIKADALTTLRAFHRGLLISQENDDEEYPPDSLVPNADNCSLLNESMKCSWTGDLRAQQNIGLLSVQTLWLREHNRIAKNLSEINPHWDDERLFQTARRIVEARYEHIVFKEYLPKMIGLYNMQNFNLTPLEDGFTIYNESVNPTLTNEFSAAAFRFGHAQIAKNFWRFTLNGSWLAPLNISTGYFIPHNNTDENHNSVLRGSLIQPSQAFNRHGDESVRGNLFRPPFLQYGLDLFAIDIQRGRDHGIRPYVDYVQHCRNITVESFQNLTNLMADEENATKLFEKVYNNVRDIDLYSGGLSEKPITGAQMGETFACIVRDAFNRLKFGDRFYYEHENQSGSFTEDQLKSIRNTTFASVFCNNIKGLPSIQRDVFHKHSEHSNPLINCSDVEDIDLLRWKDDVNSTRNYGTARESADVSC